MTPEELYKALKDLKGEEAIKAIAVPFDKWIREHSSSLESIRTKMTPYNKLIKSIPLVVGENAYVYENYKGESVNKHLFYKYAGLTPEEYAKLNNKADTKKIARLDNGTKLEASSYLDSIAKLLLSDDPNELAVGIIGATGRRPHEVLVRGSFYPIKKEDLQFPENQPESHWAMFSGQGKKRGKAKDYPIATLFPADFIIKALKKLRRMPEIQSLIKEIEAEFPKDITAQNDAIDSRRNTSLNRVVREYLPENVLLPRFHKREKDQENTCSSLRAAYARLATERDCPRGKNDLLWASRLLGHFSADADLRALLTTAGYFDYYIEKDDEVPLLDAPKSEPTAIIRGFASDVEGIKNFQEKFGIASQHEALRKIWELAQEAMRERDRKLLEPQQQQQVTEEQEMNEETLTALIERVLESKLPGLVEKAVEGKLGKDSPAVHTNVNANTPVSTPASTPAPTQEPPVEPKPEKDWSQVPSESLKGSHTPGSAEEKIRRTVKAIMDWNDYSAPSSNERWFIGVRSIQD
jgi:hypothetical protein